MSIIRELKRRNVFRVAAAYLTGGWLLVEVSETLFPIYGLSDAAVRLVVTLLAIGFGVIGLGIILLVSRKEGRMVHCTAYCPIGTIVNLTRFINPFRLSIDKDSCTECMACTSKCKYDALNRKDILSRKPGLTCTLCGDCLSSCHAGSIHYRFPRLSAQGARMLYLLITISLHAATMGLARI